MNKIFFCLLLFASILPCYADTFVAVLETVAENGAVGRSERLFLTDKLRERAKKALPAYMGYVIMTRENILQMLPPGKKIEDCEGECLVETGKNINAHYVAQARVGKFGSSLTVTVELYETMNNNLVGSFTARKLDADGLLDEIERQADDLFGSITGGNVIGGFEEKNGFSDVNMGGHEFKVSGSKSFILNISSNPDKAMLSIDGRPIASCAMTPCDVSLKSGNHRFSFGKDMYFNKDTLLDVNSAGQSLNVDLMPNFGVLILAPQLQYGIGSTEDFVFEIDGEIYRETKNRLPAGIHSVKVSNRCYETVSFTVNVKNGSELTFDRTMLPLMGGLELNVVENDNPKAVPVFVNDNEAGVTPFLEAVPVCSKITVGDIRDEVKVTLKKNETVTYTHIQDNERADTLTDNRDGQKYKITRIGEQVWMAQNLNYKTGMSGCYDHKSSNCNKYGRLYDWITAVQACPEGWRLPNNDDWNALWRFIGSEKISGQKLKSKIGWGKKGNGENLFEFAVLPAGYRDPDGAFGYAGGFSFLWSSSEYDSDNAYSLRFGYNNAFVLQHYNGKNYAFSVRCIKE